MVVDTVIRGGEVVTTTDRHHTDVAINDGRIVGLGREPAIPEADRVVDATGLLVLPGVVDPHVHVDEVPESRAGTYRAETAAAAVGGVTTFVDFAFQGGDRALIDDDANLLDGIARKRAKADQAHVDFSLHGVLHRETEDTLDQVSAAVDVGVTSFKMFMSNYTVGVTNGFVVRAFEAIADEDAVAAMHTEDPSVCDALTKKLRAEGKGDPVFYPESRPDYTEAMAADDALRMAEETGVKYYGIHTTCRESADVIAHHQGTGRNVRGETCVHYTTLDESVYSDVGNLARLAPPIRTPDDIEAMFEHIRAGTLDVVSTDHAVYHREYKEVEDWWDSPLGINSLQHALSLFHDEAVVKRGLSYPALVRLMSTNPARIFGMPWKGTLEPGTDADIVLFDPAASYVIDATDNRSNSEYSVYDGREVTGRVERTFLRGTPVARDGEVTGTPGDGEFVEREIPDWSD